MFVIEWQYRSCVVGCVLVVSSGGAAANSYGNGGENTGKPPAENLKDYKSNELIREQKFRNATEANYHVARALFFVALDS